MRYNFIPKGVCAREISFDLEDGIVRNIQFVGGCNGNLKALSKVLEGWKVEDVVERLQGNTCGMKNTSCADQLTKALISASENK